MAALSAQQIASLAQSAGVPENQVAKAVAIALAESGGNPRAYNGVGGDRSYGLWQINMIGALGPDRRKKLNLTSNDQLFDPAINARAMALISGGGKNWLPWTTYTRGTYLRFMSEANSAAGSPSAIPAGLPGADSFASILDVTKKLQQPGFWIRIAMFWAGLTLLLIALARLTGNNQLSSVTKTAIKAVAFKKVSK